VNIRRIVLLHVAALLAACSVPNIDGGTPAAPRIDAPAAATATGAPRLDLAGAAGVAQSFVDALNSGDYVAAHALLDPVGRTEAATAADLQAAYDEARAPGRVTAITARMAGGLIPGVDGVVDAQLSSEWESPLLGRFPVTTSLRLADAGGGRWGVRWTRDAIAAGFDGGAIILQQTWLPRGAIVTADGIELVGPAERRQIGVQRSRIVDAEQEQRMLAALESVTGIAAEKIRAAYADAPADWFIPIAALPVEKVNESAALLEPFPAVTARALFIRQRHRSDIAPHLIGSLGPIPAENIEAYRERGYRGDEMVGLSGLEAAAEDLLAGRPERMLYVSRGQTLQVLSESPAVRGADVVLSIRSTLQITAQALLEGRRGAIVVLDVRDGSVLAMASAPTFDPTNVKQADVDGGALLNRAAQGLYPPGSTFKMVTMAAALGEGAATPDTVYLDNGTWSGFGAEFTKTCWRKGGHGRITLQNGLTASCNIVFYEVGKQLEQKGSGILGDYARRFGFGAPTGIELSSESAGVAPDPDYVQRVLGAVWRPGDTVNMAVGQGYVLATPLQVARMTAAIADGGRLRTPHLIGSPALPRPEPRALPLSAEHLAAMQEAMVGVTTNARIGTTTYRFADFEYYEADGRWVAAAALTKAQRASLRKLIVAGKSGTAQAPGDVEPHAWFTAYAPADAPEIAVAVLLENAGQGSGRAGPVARQVIEAWYGLPISSTPTDALEND
jgi:penicillin-binding protein 2